MKCSFDLVMLNDGRYYLPAKDIQESGIGQFNGKHWIIEMI